MVAVASLTVGNLAAITQTNVKRMLAYSSISHVGYILLGLVAALSGPDGNETGLKGIAFYLFVYAFMTIGAFAILIVLRRQGLIGDELDDLNGLIQRSPTAAVLLLIFMLSLAGIPPLAGFVGKYFILLSLIQTQHYYLALFGALYIVPALYYYFRIVAHAWLREPAQRVQPHVTRGPVRGACGDVRRDRRRRYLSRSRSFAWRPIRWCFPPHSLAAENPDSPPPRPPDDGPEGSFGNSPMCWTCRSCLVGAVVIGAGARLFSGSAFGHFAHVHADPGRPWICWRDDRSASAADRQAGKRWPLRPSEARRSGGSNG